MTWHFGSTHRRFASFWRRSGEWELCLRPPPYYFANVFTSSVGRAVEGTVGPVFSTNDKRAMNQGFGDGMSRAFELVATPMVFGGIGYLVDRLAGTMPIFTVLLGAFGIVGTFVRAWYGYDAEMRSIEQTGRWNRGAVAGEPEQPPTDLWNARRERAS